MTGGELAALVVVALAGFRLARAVAVDDITAPMRAWVSRRAYTWPALPLVEAAQEGRIEPRYAEPARRTRRWAWAYGLISCAHCAGFWLTLGVWWVWEHVERSHGLVAAVAAAGLQSALAARAMGE